MRRCGLGLVLFLAFVGAVNAQQLNSGRVPGHKASAQQIADEANLNSPQIVGQSIQIRRVDRRTRDLDPRYKQLENRYVVLFKTASPHSEQDIINKIRARGGGTLHFSYTHPQGVNGFAATLAPAVAQQFASDPTVAMIEEDRIAVGLALPVPASPETSVFGGGALPWALDRIDQAGLAGTVTLNGLFNFPQSGGQGIHIYYIDEGTKGGSLGQGLGNLTGNPPVAQFGTGTHQEFDGRLGAGADFQTPFTNADDCFDAGASIGHGTFGASLAAGTTMGLAKLAIIHPVRVIDCGDEGSSSAVIAGVNWVTADHLAHPGQKSIANMSLTVNGVDSAVDAAVQNSINNGVVYTIASGNSGQFSESLNAFFGFDVTNACNFSPQRVGAAITVGASESNPMDMIWEDSTTGGCVDLYAPGKLMTGATALGTSTYAGPPYDNSVHFGTSWSAPLVAGAVALLWSANPTMNSSTVASAAISNSPDNSVVPNDLFGGSVFDGGAKRLLYTGFPTNVQVGLTSNQGAPAKAQTFAYTIQIKNNGPLNTLDPVQFVDTLPADVILNSLTASGASCSGTSTITCNIGSMTVGQQATITLNVSAPQAVESFTNSAVASLVGQVNSNGTNGQASLTLSTH